MVIIPQDVEELVLRLHKLKLTVAYDNIDGILYGLLDCVCGPKQVELRNIDEHPCPTVPGIIRYGELLSLWHEDTFDAKASKCMENFLQGIAIRYWNNMVGSKWCRPIQDTRSLVQYGEAHRNPEYSGPMTQSLAFSIYVVKKEAAIV